MIHFAGKYSSDFEQGLLANANAGGENVHRGIILGALLGAEAGERGIPEHLKTGLKDFASIQEEIENFKRSVLSRTEAAM